MCHKTRLFALPLCLTTFTVSAGEPDLDRLQPSRTPCCGASGEVVGADRSQFDKRGLRGSGTEGCICLKYIYARWANGTCSFYATDCYGSPFSWDDLCDAPHPGECDATSCGTCFFFPEQPAPRLAANKPLAELMDHAVAPVLHEEAGATFFDSPFFVRIRVPELDDPIRAKVFPIMVGRREADGQTLPAQVFYQGVEVKDFPAGVKARPAEGQASARHQCQVIDRDRVLQIKTHTRLTSD